MRDLVRLASVLLVACALSAPPAFGSESQSFTQSPEAVSIRGRVLDPRHAPIMGALVTARVHNSNRAPSATTDARGEFSLWLPPGDYTLVVTADGFVEASQRIGADGAGDVHEFVLQIAGVRESVSVTAPRGYDVAAIGSATKTFTPARDVPQSISVVTQELVKDQLMS